MTQNTARHTLGIDVSDRFSYVCALDPAGEVVEEARLPTTREAFRSRFEIARACRIALEAGTHSPWMQPLLEELGHEVIVANPSAVAKLTTGPKTDRRDAEALARFARLDPAMLRPLRHRSREVQVDRHKIRARARLVQARTQLVNHVRGTLKSFGTRAPSCSTRAFARKVEEHVPSDLLPAIRPILHALRFLDRQIERLRREIERLARDAYPETGHLQEVGGIGPLTSLAFVLTIEDPHRFSRSRTVGAYLGLCPKQRQSGERDPELGITKTGDPYLRALLVQSAHYILGPFGKDCDLRRHGERIIIPDNRASKRKAVVAVTRKLAVLLHRLWVTGEPYEPLRNSRRRPQAA